MGFAPEVVDRMTLWEFAACFDGWAISKGMKKSARKMTDAEYDALVALGDEWNQEAAGNG